VAVTAVRPLARALALIAAVVGLAWVAPVGAAGIPRHEITVAIDPAARTLHVVDTLHPERDGAVEFRLNANLKIVRAEPTVREIVSPSGRARGSGAARPGETRRYIVEPARGGVIVVEYEGRIDDALSAESDEFAKGFRSTSGIVAPEGVYLSGATAWYPQLSTDFVRFSLTARAPEGWHLVSEGEGTSRDDAGNAHWTSDAPLEEIHLVGGPLQRYRDASGPVEALVYMRAPDPALAERYLSATARYVSLYDGLIGAYPYAKFALVENFWETGAGMPSFTLLGSKVIRLPFIVDTSYPHEILHNWWGNSVFVDERGGNWSEGLTAYLADHLIAQRRGTGAQYRLEALEKFDAFVDAERDLPLSAFGSRHSGATQAVGYGKSAMFFHMLRRRLGDERFERTLERLYREQRGRRASFDDLRRAAQAESESDADLRRFFNAWTQRTGAPALRVSAQARPVGGGWRVSGELAQVQREAPFPLVVPLVLQTAGGEVRRDVVLNARTARFRFDVAAEPLALRCDPFADVFRHVVRGESPPTLGRVFGAPRALAVVPAQDDDDARAAYRSLAQAWSGGSQQVEVVTDRDIARLPSDRAVWLFGRGNAWAREVFPAEVAAVASDALTLGGKRVPVADYAIAMAGRLPGDAGAPAAWIVVDPPQAAAALARKLPHYGSQSYAAFAGTEAANVAAGRWPRRASALDVDLRAASARSAPLPALESPERPLR
jgi:aminopeptidase N